LLGTGRRVVVIGTGWIGSEVAASARQMDARVALVGPDGVPLEGMLGTEVGAVYRDLHAAHGVELRLGRTAVGVAGDTVVEEVRLDDGSVLPAEVVVIGIGALPRLDLAVAAGVELDAATGGVLVDEHLETTRPGVFAAGDIASVPYARYGSRVRLEHWSAALNQGPVAARNMLGESLVYDRLPYFFSDQYGLGMEYRGWAAGSDGVVVRGDPASGAFLAFWCRGDRVLAAMNANIWDAGDVLTSLLERDGPVDRTRLADPDVDLASLVPSAR
jgi:3-phenylpropionate/trans-cinnamate dioxygenase ferredoxin reductase subunit